jgi:alkanesulfonate monooxygenase SsuD/methylene tetrahydromethanopterin reductase-like flavin-dependent oxidoreductase (luciferase family)
MMSEHVDEIRSGIFIMPFHDPAKPLSQCFDEDLELIIRADELGINEFWIGEHHTMKAEPIVSPEVFIARALGETENIRMGPAPICLPQHHPASVASRIAFLDHLSKGRINLCFGPGSVTTDNELYGIDPKNSGAMAFESLDMILKLWANEPPYLLEGKYWTIRLEKNVDEETGIGYIHKPYQRPHPPIAIPGMSRDSYSMKFAGRMGFAPFSHCLIPGNVVADLWKTYAAAAREADRTPDRAKFHVARSIFLADTTREAQSRARTNSVGKNYQYIGRLLDKGQARKMYKRDVNMSDADCNLDYLMTEQIIAGDVDEVLRRLLQLVEETGPFGTLVMMGYDWDDKDSWIRNLELFQTELVPALNKALCGADRKSVVV